MLPQNSKAIDRTSIEETLINFSSERSGVQPRVNRLTTVHSMLFTNKKTRITTTLDHHDQLNHTTTTSAVHPPSDPTPHTTTTESDTSPQAGYLLLRLSDLRSILNKCIKNVQHEGMMSLG